ncbi:MULTISPECIES: hypothetical protein [unclassified Microcoleus]|uniref:hypothetical protein n=1 Tax=unclassified Microcoleus TaxID=2642155 RepID=UPI002FD74F71
MATITAGTGATINATTIEGQIWQLIHFIQNGERGNSESERFTGKKTDTFVMEGEFTIPGGLIYTPATGLFALAAAPYLSSLTFAPGSPLGTIKGATLAQYFIDAVSYAVAWQNNNSKNNNSLTNITLDFDYNTQLYSGTFKLPYNTALSANGSVVETAAEWLLT